MFRYFAGFIAFALLQQPQIGIPHVGLGDGPFIIDTAEQHKIRVVVVTKGLQHPWSLAFMPDGLLYLLTEEEDGALLRIEPGP